jgi:hypothetical protein
LAIPGRLKRWLRCNIGVFSEVTGDDRSDITSTTEARLSVHARPDLSAIEFVVRDLGRTTTITIDREQATALIGELLSAILDTVSNSRGEPSPGPEWRADPG